MTESDARRKGAGGHGPPEARPRQTDAPGGNGELARSEQRHRMLARAMSAVVWTASGDGRVLQVQGWSEYTGQRESERAGDGWLSALHEDDRELARDRWESAVREGEPMDAECRLWNAEEGSHHYVHVRCLPIKDESGQVREWVGAVTDIDERRRAEERLKRSERRFRQIVQQASDSLFIHSASGEFLEVNQQAADSLGYTREELLCMTVPEVEQSFDLREFERLMDRLEPGGSAVFEGLHRRKDGTAFPVELSVGLFEAEGPGEPPLALAIARDITRRKRIERELAASGARLSATFEQSPLAIHIFSPDGASVKANEAWRKLRAPQDDPPAANVFEDGLIRDAGLLPYLRQAASGTPATSPALPYVPRSAGRPPAQSDPTRWLRAFAYPIGGGHARRAPLEDETETSKSPPGERISEVVLLVEDVTGVERARREKALALEQETEARAEAERERERMSFLAEAGRRLSDTLDYEETLQTVVSLATRHLADWCVLRLTDSRGAAGQDVRIGHSDSMLADSVSADGESQPEALARLRDCYQRSAQEPPPFRDAQGAGSPFIIPEVDEARLRALALDDEHLRCMRALGVESLALVPLSAHGRTFASLTLVSSDPQRRYVDRDLALMEDFATRSGQALHKAGLYQQRSNTARTLQQSLLPPELPGIPGVESYACYRPAGPVDSGLGQTLDETAVGGDFYDVFKAPIGWVLLVGDVCGKGAEAAQITALSRYTLRAVAMYELAPSQIVQSLNAAMLNQLSEYRFCTLACGVLNPLEEDGNAVEITICLGGHPPPLVVRADGSVEEAGSRGTLVGVLRDMELTDATVRLYPDDAIVFYTDGVTEARNPSGGFFGAHRLEQALASAPRTNARGLVQHTLERLDEFSEGANQRDDVALLAFRVTP